jgi:hypothetical protein
MTAAYWLIGKKLVGLGSATFREERECQTLLRNRSLAWQGEDLNLLTYCFGAGFGVPCNSFAAAKGTFLRSRNIRHFPIPPLL